MSRWLPLLLVLLAPLARATGSLGLTDSDLLDPDEAFAVSMRVTPDNHAEVSWKIAPGYYMYRDRIHFSTDTPGITLGTPALPPAETKNDPFFGKLAIYHNQVTARIPVTRDPGAGDHFELKAVSQGCAEAGVCYPPHTQTAKLVLASAADSGSTGATASNGTGTVPANTSPLGTEPHGEPAGPLGAVVKHDAGLLEGEQDFLDPDAAFQVDVYEDAPDHLRVHWVIADGYYLYKNKFRISLPDTPGVKIRSVDIPGGDPKHDEFLGDVTVFHHEATAEVALTRDGHEPRQITLAVGYQGCAEAGICYPPIKKQLPVSLAADDAGSGHPAGTATPAMAGGKSATGTPPSTDNQDDIARVLAGSSLGWVVLFFFGAGVLLAFTACMYPMIPIISSIIVGQGKSITTTRAFLLSLVYVEAVAITYAVIGVVSAQLGAGVQAFFQNPWILGTFALVFVLLALSMFGFFTLQMPSALQARLSDTSNRMRGGTLLGVAVMGVLSALIVGPCAGPVLIGALIYTSHSGDYLTGALAMFALGNGLGAPLLIIGTTGGKLLPKAGGWMDTVKAVFGVILLGVAILMLERILPGPATLLLWALWLIVPAIYMGALDSLGPDASGWRRLWKGLGIAMLVYGIILIIGATTGAHDPLNPLRNLNTGQVTGSAGGQASRHLPFTRIKTVADLDQALAQSRARHQPAMLDFYADWCTYCVKMDDYTFSDATVQQALAGTTLLQADVTANDKDDLALLNHFGLFAPPAILFFDDNGSELRSSRLIGFRNAPDFLAHLDSTFHK
jgi:thiol:disulfide interchange protein DsbD